ncbi:MAG: hypothetical protein EBU96_11880 [Actinobacteria bacterium]|nr:hypothetical protein [Actinomycetota bacterium]
MTREDIIRMAGHRDVPPWVMKLVMDCVEAEREECAKAWRTTMNRDDIIRMAVECQLVTTTNRDGIYMKALERFAELVAAAEREACAVALETQGGTWDGENFEIAGAIRARGEK